MSAYTTAEAIDVLWAALGWRVRGTYFPRSDWDVASGRDLGRALRRKGLVKERRKAGWVAVGNHRTQRLKDGAVMTAGSGEIDPATSDWPTGF